MINKTDKKFRTGCTSYIIPDNIIPNVEKVAHLINDVELLCFESPDRSYYIDEQTIEKLAELARINDLSYTVHCPVDYKAGAADKDERERFVSGFIKIFNLTLPLEPRGFILHLEGLEANPKLVYEVCSRIVDGIPANYQSLICLENLDHPVEMLEAVAARFKFSFCIDIGHLWRYGQDWENYCSRVIDKTRVIHLHGVENSVDHLSLKKHDHDQLNYFKNSVLNKFNSVVTLEVFSEAELIESLAILENL
jgi:sugar phosphate isomerase/epimerase